MAVKKQNNTNSNTKKNILITGVSGYFGASLAKFFLAQKNIGKVVGTDLKQSEIKHPNFVFEDLDALDTEGHIRLLKKYDVDCVCHLAFIMGEHKDKLRVRKTNIHATLNIMDAANSVESVSRIVFAASVSAYGAHESNKLYIKEDHPLRADTIQYGMNKMFVEKEIAKVRPFLRKSLDLAVLRVCTIVGPSARGESFVSSFLKSPVGMSILGRECPLQFVHEEDLLNLFSRVCNAKKFSGVYNVAPREYTSMKRLSHRLKKPVIYVPYSFLYCLFWLLFRLKPQLGISENTVSYISYPIIVDSSRLEKALNFEFKFGSEDAFLACAKALSK